MRRRFYYFLVLIFFQSTLFGQETPNVANATELSPNTAAGAQAATATVDYFTGIPSVSVPLYSYSGKGMHLNITAEYIGGGAKDGQEPSTIGMGWYLDAGGLITRTVRGTPDDISVYGFMNTGAIPTDFRSNGDKYYYDSLDAQPDIFEYNFNGRSGKFFIGKNHQIVVVPESMLKIQYTYDGGDDGIISFKITDESGVKYIFQNPEFTSQSVTQGNNFYKSAYSGAFHNSAWYLSKIISPFNTDSITFNYTSKVLHTTFAYPSVSIVDATYHSQIALYSSTGTNSSSIMKLSSISFPDKTTATLEYSNVFQYDDSDYAVTKLKISDSIFRKGYMFDYQTSYSGPIIKYNASNGQDVVSSASYPTNLLLKSITPYTGEEAIKGYSFTYYVPYPNFHTYADRDSVLNAYDYWGYFNGWSSRTDAIPYISGISSGANRSVSTSRVIENALSYVYYPTGGATHYEYEPNVTQTATIQQENVSLNVTASTNITLTQVFNTLQELTFQPGNVSRSGSPPFSGTCNLVFNIKSTDGVTLYATTTISLYDLFYLGLKKWQFNVPNGTYKLESSLSGGGTVPGGYYTQVSWNNKISSASDAPAGGIRVSKILNQASSADTVNNVITEQFLYTLPNGRSSGFLGDVPSYYYPYQKIVTSTSTTTNLYVVNSDPINTMNYAQDNNAGYSRVTVYKGTTSKNSGKIVYEFTDLSDVNANFFYATFPYGPEDIKDWGLGLPKRTLIYDSSGTLIQSKTNHYTFNDTTYATTDFKGLKLGCSATTYANDPDTYPTTARTNTYIGQEYYISSGNSNLNATIDTVFHSDGSIQTDSTGYTYDNYFNLTKAVSSYDRTKGLNLETRIYYPYNYTFSSGSIKTLKDSGIITPVISTEKWITGDANPRMVDASITDFQTLTTKQIVPIGSYKFQSNQPIGQSTIGVFNPSQLIRNGTYLVQQTSHIVYDAAGNDVQVINSISGERSSVIYDYNNQLIIAKVSNSPYGYAAYTSFESDGKGDWTTIGSSLRDQTSSITGKQSYNLSNGTVTKTGLSSATTYIVTLWAKSGASVTVNGTSMGTALSTHGNWSLYSVTLTGTTSITVSGSGLIDELRLFPKDANMITYTYEPNVGVTSVCDANNTIIYTEYDNLNRPKIMRDIDKNIIKRYDYSDSAFRSTVADWEPTSRVCETGIDNVGKFDSSYTDENPYSDTYNSTLNVFKGYDYCSCSTDPQYKIVSGSCEKGQKIITGSSRFKEPDGTWEWQCIYHYKWSDNSISTPDTYEYHPDSPTSPCYVDGGEN